MGHVFFELGIIILDKVMIFAGGSVYIGYKWCIDIGTVLPLCETSNDDNYEFDD